MSKQLCTQICITINIIIISKRKLLIKGIMKNVPCLLGLQVHVVLE